MWKKSVLSVPSLRTISPIWRSPAYRRKRSSSVVWLLPRGAARYGRSCSAASGLRATVALNAGRGAKARRARRRALRLRLPPLLMPVDLRSGRSVVVKMQVDVGCNGPGSLSVRVMREGARDAPALRFVTRYGGGLARRLRLLGA